MEFDFNDILCGDRLLIHSGNINLEDVGISVLSGENGIGKTLFAKMLFQQCSDSAVFVDQSNDVILHELSIIENISLSSDKSINENIEALLIDLGLSDMISLDSKKLSGGEKRIIAILRGIFSDVPIIFIDEPTNDLDYTSVSTIVSMFGQLRRHKLFFIISHDDRIIAEADSLFAIENRGVVQIEVEKKIVSFSKALYIDLALYVEQKKNINFRVLFSRIFSLNYFYFIICIMFAVMAIAICADVKSVSDLKIKKIHDGQIEVISPLSIVGQTIIQQGALPIEVIKTIRETDSRSVLRMGKRIKESVEKSLHAPITLNLAISKSANYSIYPLEYYNVDDKIHYTTLDTYLEQLESVQNNDTIVIDTDSYFSKPITMPLDDDDVIYEFDMSIFNDSIISIMSNKGNIQPVFLTLVMKSGEGDTSVFKSNDLQEILNGNFYVRSNETIELMNQIESINCLKRNIFRAIISIFISLITGIMYTHSYMILCIRKIRIFKNHGVGKKILKKHIQQRINNRILNIIVILTVMLLTTAINFWEVGRIPNIGEGIIYGLFVLSIIVLYKISRVIVSKRIDKIYRWSFR